MRRSGCILEMRCLWDLMIRSVPGGKWEVDGEMKNVDCVVMGSSLGIW